MARWNESMVDSELLAQLPAMLNLNNLPQSQQSITFYAALPSFKPFGGNFSPDGQLDKGARFSQVNLDTPDLYT